MTATSPICLTMPSPAATCALARALGVRLRAGDVLLMEGGIGAGKTHFARCLIQSLLPAPEDVPSPTFTLVQVYEAADFEIWHSDLYRLTDPDQVVELGLTEAFETALCLVEWPDRLADLSPQEALWIRFADAGDSPEARALELSWTAGDWGARLQGVAA
ncbi:tRNA (adenosine(37)-N6)-threonylcarbamoyltransferase complex ATPase subunit type 1 TsaE [Mesobacterium sp. TK19101]|uniref:tRNA threonylcarbamoyladenosine biosynthesis protein TsaE n=1 Tax=Mesobacterium hydrothermale TaxID=3111907 RepID=A0ABU6HHL8_9RHOB|nr:tRNA (adenosine(37)-N6)-threonylcarbamoyltransferase complex ATPase subunit type 1 TsaE [Mesobacterium sp. TK19101]MEC3861597.1 tRNA (adenosine(37)-N6)-threonylcarbamoyltransferase complex ATPase subunit type 1 TsaE [Mesobacterium sp. TK19101]